MLRIGVIGLSEGNGHPYSWSAIINGFDKTKELIEKEKIGLIYTSNNLKDLLAKLKLLVENKDLLNEMSLNSFTIFNKKFDSKKIYKNLINFIFINQ